MSINVSLPEIILRLVANDANSVLNGRGGGKGSMAQGSFGATLGEIEKYFQN